MRGQQLINYFTSFFVFVFAKENRYFSSGDEFFARLRETLVLNTHDSLIRDKVTKIFRLFSTEFS